jgi:prepilin-type N-terminal cleavage/methylation domain-containing protein
MTTRKRHELQGFSLLELLVVVAVVAALVGIGNPLFLRAGKNGNRSKALSNAKAIAGGLLVFRNENGTYPCAATRELLEEEAAENLPKGKDANAYLAQLIVTDAIDSEEPFFTPGVPGMVKGDNIKRPGELLKKGENGFCYLMAKDELSLAGELSVTPLVITPLKKNGKTPTFDPAPYDGKYVYGTVDGAAHLGDISPKGVATSQGRTSLFEQGRDSLFGEDVPVLKAPTGF